MRSIPVQNKAVHGQTSEQVYGELQSAANFKTDNLIFLIWPKI